MERAGEAEGEEEEGGHRKGQKGQGLQSLSWEGERAHIHGENLEKTDGQDNPGWPHLSPAATVPFHSE